MNIGGSLIKYCLLLQYDTPSGRLLNDYIYYICSVVKQLTADILFFYRSV